MSITSKHRAVRADRKQTKKAGKAKKAATNKPAKTKGKTKPAGGGRKGRKRSGNGLEGSSS